MPERAAAARELARRLGADDLIIFVRDSELDVFLPALGFPQTLPKGVLWARFVADCVQHGHIVGELPYPTSADTCPAHGFALSPQLALVFLDGVVDEDTLELIKPLLPLLVALMQGERERVSLDARVEIAQRAAVESNSLAHQLDGARAALHNALIESQESSRQMRRQATELSSIIEALPDAAFVCDPQGVVVRANGRVRDLLSTAESEQSTIWEHVHLREIFARPLGPAGQIDAERMLASALRGEQQTSMTFSLRRASDASDARVAQFLVNAAPVHDESGAIVEVVFVATDVTELERLSRQKDEFLSIASHEMRTPLTTVKAMFQLLARRLRKQGNTHTALLERIMTSIERMERLVTDLVEGSRIESGNLSLSLQRVDLGNLCRDTAETQAETLNRVITVSIPAGPTYVTADSDRIAQVLANLIGNAAKYSTEDRTIALTMTTDAQAVRVEITDHGVGIPEERQARVFDRFYRVPEIEVQSGSGVGLGLGLFIVRSIVERHRGRVGVKSAPGEGSTFWFELPSA